MFLLSCACGQSGMRESEVEKYFIAMVKASGGLVRKFVSPNHKGVPDRIVVFCVGRVYFVELKAPGKPLREDQEREHKRLRNVGAKVYVIDNKESVDAFISKEA